MLHMCLNSSTLTYTLFIYIFDRKIDDVFLICFGYSKETTDGSFGFQQQYVMFKKYNTLTLITRQYICIIEVCLHIC